MQLKIAVKYNIININYVSKDLLYDDDLIIVFLKKFNELFTKTENNVFNEGYISLFN